MVSCKERGANMSDGCAVADCGLRFCYVAADGWILDAQRHRCSLQLRRACASHVAIATLRTWRLSTRVHNLSRRSSQRRAFRGWTAFTSVQARARALASARRARIVRNLFQEWWRRLEDGRAQRAAEARFRAALGPAQRGLPWGASGLGPQAPLDSPTRLSHTSSTLGGAGGSGRPSYPSPPRAVSPSWRGDTGPSRRSSALFGDARGGDQGSFAASRVSEHWGRDSWPTAAARDGWTPHEHREEPRSALPVPVPIGTVAPSFHDVYDGGASGAPLPWRRAPRDGQPIV